MSGTGSQAEKLKGSKCFLLFSQQRTSRPRYVSLVPSLVALDHRSGFFALKKLELLRVNENVNAAKAIPDDDGDRDRAAGCEIFRRAFSVR